MLDASGKFDEPLTVDRLFAWHAALFSGMTKIRIGAWRDDTGGSMQVVSGAYGGEKVHYRRQPNGLHKKWRRFLTGSISHPPPIPL